MDSKTDASTPEPLVKLEGDLVTISHGGYHHSRTLAEWAALFNQVNALEDEVRVLKYELDGCHPDRWIPQVRGQLADKAGDIDRLRAAAREGSEVRAMLTGQAQAYRDALGMLREPTK